MSAPTRGAVREQRARPRGERPSRGLRLSLSWQLAIFVLALAVRTITLLELRGTVLFAVLTGDARVYHHWALEILQGSWLGSEVFYQAPLYPYFLASTYTLAGPNPAIIRVLQTLVGAAACVLVARAGSRFFGIRAGVAAGILLALYAPAVFFDVLIQKTSLATAGLALLLEILSRLDGAPGRRWAFAAGAALGALVLLRENALVMLPVVIVWVVMKATRGAQDRPAKLRAGILAGCLALAGLGVILAPVALRNLGVGGELALTTSQLGPNFYIGNHLGANGRYQPLRPRGGDARVEAADARELASAAVGRELSPGEVSRYWLSRAFQDIRGAPFSWIRLQGHKARLLLHHREGLDTDALEAYAERSRILAVLARLTGFGLLLSLAVAGGVARFRRATEAQVFLGLLVIALATSIVAFYVVGRYRMLLVPPLCLFAGAGTAAGFEALRQHRWRGLLQLAGAATLGALLAGLPMANTGDPRTTTYLNLGLSLDEEGRSSEAVEPLRRAVALEPTFAPARAALGRALVRAGRRDEALEPLRKAIDLDRDDAASRTTLGYLLAQRGDPQGLGLLQEAVSLNPGSAHGHSLLGNALAAAGRLEEARAAYERALALDPRLPDAQVKLERLRRDLQTPPAEP